MTKSPRRLSGLSLLSVGLGGAALLLTGCSAAGSIPSATPSSSCSTTDLTKCGTYTSTSGTDHGKDVSWLSKTPLKLTFEELNSAVTLVMKTPCNAVNIPVKVSGTTLIPDVEHITATAMGCLGDGAGQEAWATDFAKHLMTYNLAKQELTLKADASTIKLVK